MNSITATQDTAAGKTARLIGRLGSLTLAPACRLRHEDVDLFMLASSDDKRAAARAFRAGIAGAGDITFP